MAVWSNALPLTASYLSPLSGFESPRVSEKVASDLVWGGGFRRLHRFLPPNWLVTNLSRNMAKSYEKRNSTYGAETESQAYKNYIYQLRGTSGYCINIYQDMRS